MPVLAWARTPAVSRLRPRDVAEPRGRRARRCTPRREPAGPRARSPAGRRPGSPFAESPPTWPSAAWPGAGTPTEPAYPNAELPAPDRSAPTTGAPGSCPTASGTPQRRARPARSAVHRFLRYLHACADSIAGDFSAETVATRGGRCFRVGECGSWLLPVPCGGSGVLYRDERPVPGVVPDRPADGVDRHHPTEGAVALEVNREVARVSIDAADGGACHVGCQPCGGDVACPRGVHRLGVTATCPHHPKAGVPHHCRARFGTHRAGAGMHDDLRRRLTRAVLEFDVEAVVEPDHLAGVQPGWFGCGRGPGPSR